MVVRFTDRTLDEINNKLGISIDSINRHMYIVDE